MGMMLRSGHPWRAAAGDATPGKGAETAFLQKPFTPTGLAARVGAELDERPAE